MVEGPRAGVKARESRAPGHLLDTCVWIDYFRDRDSAMGDMAAEIIDVDDPAQPRLTHSLCLAELRKSYGAWTIEFGKDLAFLRERSLIVEEVPEEIALRAGAIKHCMDPLLKARRKTNNGLSYVDCVLLATAIVGPDRLVTREAGIGILSQPEANGLEIDQVVRELGLAPGKKPADVVLFLEAIAR